MNTSDNVIHIGFFSIQISLPKNNDNQLSKYPNKYVQCQIPNPEFILTISINKICKHDSIFKSKIQSN